MGKDRFVFIDWLKTVGIFLVVVGHMPMGDNMFRNWIYSFHMPLFFFVSGFLYHQSNDLFSFLKKNAQRLLLVLIPYMILHICFTYIQDYLFYKDNLSIDNNLIEPLCAWTLGKSEMGPMWFLVSLFVMKVVVGFYDRIIKISDSYRYLILLIASLCVAIIAYNFNFYFNYYQIASAVYGLPLLVLGIIVRQFSLNRLFHNVIILSIVVVASVVLFPQNHVSWNGLAFANGFALLYIQAILGIALLSSIFSFLSKLPTIVQYISSGTLFILGTHTILIQVYKICYKMVFHITTPPPYMGAVGALFGALLIIILLYLPVKKLLDSKNWIAQFIMGKELIFEVKK